MDPKRLHNLTVLPVFIIGISSLILGIGWLLSSEPWLWDQSANEILLKISFEELFSAPINRGLPDYLNLSYTFFGWWIISIGMLILAFTLVTRLATSLSRVLISFVLLIILIGLTIIEKMYIPTSPFLYLTWGRLDPLGYQRLGGHSTPKTRCLKFIIYSFISQLHSFPLLFFVIFFTCLREKMI